MYITGVGDIEEGKDADEELCLLPDEDREISDADKERAIRQKEADENEIDTNDGEQIDNDRETGNDTCEENGNRDFFTQE